MPSISTNRLRAVRDRDAAWVRRPAIGLASAAMFTAIMAAGLTGCSGLPEPAPVTGPAIMGTSVPSGAEAAQIAMANTARDSGDYETALDIFQTILAENPTVTSAYIGIGEIHLENDEPELAEPAFRRATRLEPRNFGAQYGHGLALQLLGRLREAVLAYQRALTINPDDFQANLDIAIAYLDLGRDDRARTFAERAVDIDPASGPARVNLGAICARQNDTGQAIEHYIAALEIMGNEPRLMANLVYALSDENRYREAVNTARQLVRIEPAADIYERLGWCHFKLREYDESLDAYQRGLDLDPDHWPSLNGVGVNALNAWLLSDGDDERMRYTAGEAFRQSIRLNPQQQQVINLLIEYRL
ncbi:MAG: tetratricopeptide repeat protein [Phycisphaerales bacterium]